MLTLGEVALSNQQPSVRTLPFEQFGNGGCEVMVYGTVNEAQFRMPFQSALNVQRFTINARI